jgi:glycine/D-amino acid oxidase-like deaminating enzyme/nitrite reductase/ring-hydroxylating ferredoxin subunit
MKAYHPNESISVWHDTQEVPPFSELKQDITVDVCVVGAGIAGLTTAYSLLNEGKSVCIVEDFEIGSGQTGRTTAHITYALDDRYYEIQNMFGKEGARLAAISHKTAIEYVAQIVQEEKIPCELERVDGYLFARDDDPEKLEREFQACQLAGLNDVELLDKSPLVFFDTGPVLKFPRQLQFHPLKYLNGLTRVILKNGGQIYTNTRAVEVRGGAHAFVKTEKGATVNCLSVVVATNTPVNDRVAIHTKQAPYRTYVVAFPVPKNSVPKGLYWDTLDPYHYIRVVSGLDGEKLDLLIVGGEDHKTGQDHQPATHFRNLTDWTRQRFPMAAEVLYLWSGQVMEPIDGMGFIGHNPLDKNNVYVITGDSGNGMTHATLGAILVTDQIVGRENEWERLYNPSRLKFRSIPEYVKENANVAAQYAEWLEPKPESELETIRPGEGKVIRIGGKLVAAFKNDDGSMEYSSAACTHLKGVVSWNKVESSWDCPCHGSRFDKEGRVIEGPAAKDLQKLG